MMYHLENLSDGSASGCEKERTASEVQYLEKWGELQYNCIPQQKVELIRPDDHLFLLERVSRHLGCIRGWLCGSHILLAQTYKLAWARKSGRYRLRVHTVQSIRVVSYDAVS